MISVSGLGKHRKQGQKLTVNAVARPDLVLPLGRHDLGVGARDVDVGVHAGLVVSLDNVTAEDLAGTHTAVVRTLGRRETVLGPAIRPALEVEEGVLLLEAEPELVLLVGLHQEGGIVAEVVGVRLAVGIVGLADDEDVVAQAEGVRIEGGRAEVDIRVVAGCLAGGGAVEIPLGQVVEALNLLVERLDKSAC